MDPRLKTCGTGNSCFDSAGTAENAHAGEGVTDSDDVVVAIVLQTIGDAMPLVLRLMGGDCRNMKDV